MIYKSVGRLAGIGFGFGNQLFSWSPFGFCSGTCMAIVGRLAKVCSGW